MGGVPPLGYRVQDRKLVIVDSEAEIVRFIFRRYAELGSVRWLRDELEALSIQSKLRTSASGGISGGKPFARGALYLMLQNRIYRGEIVHNQQSYLGEHEPIIDQPLWDAVQAQHAGNAAQHNNGGKTRQPSLLAGMLLRTDAFPLDEGGKGEAFAAGAPLATRASAYRSLRPARQAAAESIHSARPPQLSRAGYHPSNPRWPAAARSDGREAARALTSAACLARSADRARLWLSPIEIQRSTAR